MRGLGLGFHPLSPVDRVFEELIPARAWREMCEGFQILLEALLGMEGMESGDQRWFGRGLLG